MKALSDPAWRFGPRPGIRRTSVGAGRALRQPGEQQAAVLLDLSTGVYHRLNRVATTLWEVLANSPEGVGFAGLVETLEQTYSCSHARAEADLLAFLTNLEAKSLIVRMPSSHPSARC